MYVRAGGDVTRSGTDGAAVFHDRGAGGNRPQRDVVAARDRFDDPHRRVARADGVTGLERLKRGRDVVPRADHDGRRHRLTPLASRPPSTTSSCPVTKAEATDAR